MNADNERAPGQGEPEQTQRLKAVYEKFIDNLSSFFQKQRPADKDVTEKTKNYLDNPIQNTEQTDQTQREKNQHKLDDLNKIINQSQGDPEEKYRAIRQTIENTLNELVTESFDQNPAFFKTLQENLTQVDKENLLPMARYLNLVLGVQESGRDEGARKIRLGLEVFFGEGQANVSSKNVIKTIITAAYKAHGLSDHYLTEDLPKLLNYYQIEPAAITDLYSSEMLRNFESLIQRRRNREREANRIIDLKKDKDNVYNSIESDEVRILTDLHLLSLEPKQILLLLQSKLKGKGENSLYINDLIKDAKDKGITITPETEQAVGKYFQNFSNKLNDLYQQSADHFRIANSTLLNQLMAIPSLDEAAIDNYLELSAYFMTGTTDAFLFTEYFKGKAAQIAKEKYSEEKLKEMVQSGKEIVLDQAEGDFEHLFKEVNKMALYAISDENLAYYYREVATSINKLKEDPLVKKQLFFGQKQEVDDQQIGVAYLYHNMREDSFWGSDSIRHIEKFRKISLDYVIPISLLEEMQGIQIAYKELHELVEQAKHGDAKTYAEAAKKATNKVAAALFSIPEVSSAYTIYLDIIQRELAINNNMLTPDLFKEDASGRSRVVYMLEEELQALHPDMSAQEKKIMSTIARGLTLADMSLLDTLAAANPPMNIIMDKIDLKDPENKEASVAIRKLQNGETPSKTEFAKLSEVMTKAFDATYHDFPFREILFAHNPFKYMWFWIYHDSYNLNILSFAPIDTNKPLPSVSERYYNGLKIMWAHYFGIGQDDDVTAENIRTKHIPALALDNNYLSVAKRAGWRNDMYFYTPNQLVIIPGKRGQRKGIINGVESLNKILRERGPTAAYQFFQRPPSNLKVDWGLKKNATDEEKKEHEHKILNIITEYLHEAHPSFFYSYEYQHHFRTKEKLNDQIETLIKNKINNNEGNEGVNRFLSEDEKSDDIRDMVEPSLTTAGEQINNIRARRIFKRYKTVLDVAEKACQKFPEITLQNFISKAPENYTNEEAEVRRAITSILNLTIKRDNDLISSESELFTEFISLTEDFFYSENSLFLKAKIRGLNYNKDKKISFEDYYTELIFDKKIDPFGWNFLYNKKLHFQLIGGELFARNVGDNYAYMEYTQGMGKLMTAVVKAQQTENQEAGFDIMLKEATDMIESLQGIKSRFGDDECYKCAWTMVEYIGSIFRAPHVTDLPIIGNLIPYQESWATFNYHSDSWKQSQWKLKKMKKFVDVLTKKGLLPYGHTDEQTMGVSKNMNYKALFGIEPVTLPESLSKFLGKEDGKITLFDEIKLPEGVNEKLRKWFPGAYAKRKKYTNAGNYTAKSLYKHLQIDDLTTLNNTLMTILVIGALYLLFQAIKEGAKEAELK